MTSKEWQSTVRLENVSSAHWDNIIADLAACEAERDRLRARLAEARWLLEHVWNPADRDADYLRRYDAWLKGGEK